MKKYLRESLSNFREGMNRVDPDKYPDMLTAFNIIDKTMDEMMLRLRYEGLKAHTCDHAFDVEAAIYNYVKVSNPLLAEDFKEVEALGEYARESVNG